MDDEIKKFTWYKSRIEHNRNKEAFVFFFHLTNDPFGPNFHNAIAIEKIDGNLKYRGIVGFTLDPGYWEKADIPSERLERIVIEGVFLKQQNIQISLSRKHQADK